MNLDSRIDDIIKLCLDEDLGSKGDITTDNLIGQNRTATADLVVRTDGVVAGLDVAARVFEMVDESISFEALANDGSRVAAGGVVARLTGPARGILTAERTALNLIGRMSGVATATAQLVEAVAGLGARISDTRKTMPGLRVLDKYAVSAGGGINHRLGLFDAVMIKDNHIAAAGDIGMAVEAVRAKVGSEIMVEVEVDNFDQLIEVLETDTDRVLLDNMDPETLKRAVALVDGRMTTEASGGVTLETVREIAETGVDIISVGWITHSPPQLDIGLDFRS